MHNYALLHSYAFCVILDRKGGIVMKSVYILMHQRKPDTAQLASSLLRVLHMADMNACAEPWLYEYAAGHGISFDACTPQECDAILSVGGDGTLLRANELAMQWDLPVLGVNVGRVGFLTEIEMDQLEHACSLLVQDAYGIESRMMLEASVNGVTVTALNDIVLSRGGYSRLIGLEAWVDDDPIGRYIGDGLIVSTPTGSTGYSLSAGGPIVCPELECMLITPICAHSLQHRPVVTSASQTVSIRLSEQASAMLSVDGREAIPFAADQTLVIRRAPKSARFIRLEPGSFFSKIRVKLSEWSC